MGRIAGTTIANQTLRRISEMIGSLFAALLLSAQPAPAEEPVVTEAPVEVQAEVQAEVAAPEVAHATDINARKQIRYFVKPRLH